MPRVVIVNGVYPPEPVVSAQMGRDLAVHLAEGGARVTVLCPFPSRPMGADYGALRPDGRPLVRVEDGVTVVRLPSYSAPQSRLVPRLRESWSFGRHVCAYLKRHLADAEVVYANAWQMLCQALIARCCGGRGLPLIWHVMDLYPESLLPKLPVFLRPVVAAPLAALDGWCVHRAQHTVVPSEGLRQVYLSSRRLAPDQVTTVLNWVDEQRFARLPERREACARYGVPEDRFTFLYLGNIGPVAGVELLIESFHRASLSRAQLVIAGDGSAKAKCLDLVKNLGVQEVRFISDPDAGNVPLLQSLGHVCLLPMRKGAGASSIPSKLMAYLLSAKPVLATMDAEGDTARFITEAQCGWVGEPENAGWLAAKMKEVAALPPAVLESLGKKGRDYGLQHFSKSQGVRRLADLVLAEARGRENRP